MFAQALQLYGIAMRARSHRLTFVRKSDCTGLNCCHSDVGQFVYYCRVHLTPHTAQDMDASLGVALRRLAVTTAAAVAAE